MHWRNPNDLKDSNKSISISEVARRKPNITFQIAHELLVIDQRDVCYHSVWELPRIARSCIDPYVGLF